MFYEPVDPVKFNIPDYFDIIKKPMDLGTIKQNLTNNNYTSFKDFIDDINLMFDNCILYNGEVSPVTVMCKNLREEFRKQYDNLYMDYYM